jgi:hypothetical protein
MFNAGNLCITNFPESLSGVTTVNTSKFLTKFNPKIDGIETTASSKKFL